MNRSTFLLIMLLSLAADAATASTGAQRTLPIRVETIDEKHARQVATPSDEQDAPWTVDLVLGGLVLSTVLALLLLVTLVRRRLRPVVAADTLVEVPDYLEPRRKVEVPSAELRAPIDDQFYALYMGRVTFVVKIYWRRVHF